MSRIDGERIRVLHVDDDPDFVELTARFLEREAPAMRVVGHTSPEKALERLSDEPFDCVVSDFDMPEMTGLAFLRAVRDDHPDLPFVLFTGKGSEEIASEAISAGVDDYMQKGSGTDQYAVFANRIERTVEQHHAKTTLEERERQYATLVGNLPGIAYRCANEPGWPVEFVSEGCRELTGYDPAAFEGTSFGEKLLDDEVRERVRGEIRAAIEDGESFELTYPIETRGGERKWLWERGCAVRENGAVVAIEGFMTDVTDRKQRERELRETRRRYRSLIDAAPDAILLADAETGEIVDANEAAAQLLGRPREELVGLHQTDLHPAEEVDRYRGLFEQHVRETTGRTPLSVEDSVVVVDADGERIPVEISANVVEIDDRRLVQGFFRDTSDRRERERELERYRTLVESVGDPMYMLDADGVVQMANAAMIDELGYDRETLVGSHVGQFMTDDDVRQGERLIADLVESGDTWGSYETYIETADGDRVLGEDKIAVMTDADGDLRGTVGVFRDITDRKERERELEQYETIVETVPDGVFVLDEAGRIVEANENAATYLGRERGELLGTSMWDLVEAGVLDGSSFEPYRELVRELLSSKTDTEKGKYLLELPDGRVFEIHLALRPYEESYRGTVGAMRDVTERERRQRELERRNERLDQFASVVSHDLRTPLELARGNLELGRERVADEPAELEPVADALDRIDRLIEDLLTLARQGETVGETEMVALERVAERAWRGTVTGDATLRFDDPGTVEADPDRLRELYENLFANAVEHAGPDVTVTVGGHEDGFYVADDGPGIPPDRREEVFERGVSDTDCGTGFGLSIVRNVARAHGWSVSATESTAGGARFEISVP
ncbi:hybrid sensor histidine kinase/response regulator [Halobacteriales archaeon QS_1_68_17]|nr:MAG: hybrid sensor histidine kinase/response regulator [Halobacteriales archaeon QS_1_68_17]